MIIKMAFYRTVAEAEKDNAITLSVLRHFAEDRKMTILPSSFVIEGIDRQNNSEILDQLAEEGFVENAAIPSGSISVGGYRILPKGEYLLENATGINPGEVEFKATLDILQAAIDPRGTIVSVPEIGVRRQELLVQKMLDAGLLEKMPVSKGLVSIIGYKATGNGRLFLDHNRWPNKYCANEI